MSYSKEKLRFLVEQIQKLPTLTEVGMRIMEMASNPNVSISELSRAIHQDPSLAARVLTVANSPFYGMARQVDSLPVALVVLGLNEVRNIAMGLSLFRVFEKMNSYMGYDRRQFWFHSTSCAVVARILGRKVGFRSEGVDFLAGLLHDMGKIVIDEYFSAEFSLIYQQAVLKKTPMIEAEREFLGESHQQVGGWLVEKWRLPETLRDAIMHHHDFFSEADMPEVQDARLVALSFLAEAFCSRYKIGWDGDSDYSDLLEPRAWHLLLSGQKCSAGRIDQIVTETLQAYSDSRSYILSV